MCLNPKLLIKSGKYKEDNYRGSAGDLYNIETYTECGCCEQCLSKRANNWVIRNAYEQLNHERKCFITLTYAKQPFFIVYKDCQDWIKRFRFEINKEWHKRQKYAKKTYSKRVYALWKMLHEKEYQKIRVFGSAEYGSLKGRPHFHLIIYGWEDKNATLIGWNKKLNALYYSETIDKTWGLGRTTYQPYGEHQQNYLALYCTPQETFKKAYKLSRQKLKQITEIVEKKIDYYPKGQRANLVNQLREYEKEFQDERKNYLLIKERNFWSTAVGWEPFFDEYAKEREHTFTAYIWDMQLPLPNSWLKKLANKYGDIDAANEMFRREAEHQKTANEMEEALKNRAKFDRKRKKDILDWADRKNIEIDVF